MSRGLIAVGLLTMLVGFGGAAYGVWTIWAQHRVITSALPVQAIVIGHRTDELKASGFVSKVPLVKYAYTVNQQPYTSETVTPDEMMLPNTWAESVFQQFPVGAAVEARYDPNDPSKAFLIGKYSIMPYLPLLVGLVIAAMGLGIVGDQVTNHDAPAAAATKSGAMVLVAKQHHLAQARVLGIVGVVGLVCGGPAIVHHLLVSTAPHERMGFLIEGAYAIAVLTILARSTLGFRRGSGFGTPVVSLDRAPAVGRQCELKVSVPTRFNGTADLQACLKCEAKDTRLFNFSEEQTDRVLAEQHFLLAKSKPAFKEGQIAGTAELSFPEQLPPSTPVDAAERMHAVWSLIVTVEGNGGRKAETTYILPVGSAPLDATDDTRTDAGLGQPAPPATSG